MNNSKHSSWLIWLIGVFFVLFQFFLQLSSGVIIGCLMVELNLSAIMGGLLSSSFYWIYTLMQIPVGILFDRQNTRIILMSSVFICSIGCFVFSASHELGTLFLGRILIGLGASFAFVGITQILRVHFELKSFAFMIGLTETIGLLGTMFCILALGATINQFGWRKFIECAGLFGLIITALFWWIKPAATIPKTKAFEISSRASLWEVLKTGKLWINGLFVGLSFTVVSVFGALWATPFIMVKLACSTQTACLINACFFLGAALSCPLFGFLTTHLPRRKPLIFASCINSAAILLVILYLPSKNISIIMILLFSLGLSCGAYIIAYPISNELSKSANLSTSTGLTNTLAMITTPLLQPFIGYHLDAWQQEPNLNIGDYQSALLIIPESLLIAAALVYFLPEKSSHRRKI